MLDDPSRRFVAIAASLALHVSLIALLAGRALVQLSVEPTQVLLTFVEVAERTTAPGDVAPESRVATPAVEPAAPITAPEAVPSPPEEVSEPVPAPLPLQKIAEPVPVSVARAKPPAKKSATAPPRPETAASDVAARGSEPPAGASIGTDSRSITPAWAPAARLRHENMLFAWMNRYKKYPLLAQRRGLEGAGSVRVRIGRDGRVLERSVLKSTGETMLDQAALDMVRRASPFPPVPPEYSGDSFEFVAPIQYRLLRGD